MTGTWILGLNQYTHSAACCLIDPAGEIRFAQAKERVTRKKFDGGDTAELVREALERCGLEQSDLGLVVANNHLFRIGPFERTLAWASALDQYRPTYLDSNNLLPGVPKHELSHHLAHAWSVLPFAPFDEGLIVVMDGIGNTFTDLAAEEEHFTSELSLPQADEFRQSPTTLDPHWGWREAETVFRFQGLELTRLFKRYTCEATPVFLYNYGFENMESLGALYSRVSSHIFGDWNACGKVMGLAPWDGRWNADLAPEETPLLSGSLEDLHVDWDRLHTEPHPNQWSESEHHPRYARLARGMQDALETIVLDFLARLRESTDCRNLCLVGGVALNSTLNGRIARECGFDQVFIPPYPGDEGVAIGCANFGKFRLAATPPSPPRAALSPYLGPSYSDKELDQATVEFGPWIELNTSLKLIRKAAEALSKGKVIAWYRSHTEFGPRALGNRSILAHPGQERMIAHINEAIKKREAFRPFAPTVLADRAGEFFEAVTPSPYMSITVQVKEERRQQIAAVVHVDGTARLQTLEREVNPEFYALIEAFEQLTGLPMVLNTSFNLAGEPMVESPHDALKSFWESELDLLFLQDRIVRRKAFPDESQYDTMFAKHRPEVTAELTTQADGEPVRAMFMLDGQVHECEAFEHDLLACCTGDNTIAALLQGFEQEFEQEPATTLSALQRMYRQRLIYFEN